MTRPSRKEHALASAALAALPPDPVYIDGVPQPGAPPMQQHLSHSEVLEFVQDDGAVARALGVAVQRSAAVRRGRVLEQRSPSGVLGALVIGTRQDDPLEAVRRDTRRQVRDAMRGVTPWRLRDRHAREQAAEDLVDKLVGAPPAWPA